MNNHVENARIHPDGHDAQSTLFPLSDFSRQPVSPRELCASINLNWMAAVRLFENGWLSFDPAVVLELSPVQNAELRFLGGLVVGGCEESMLRHLLAGLVKPYAYRWDRLYYDWESQCWQLAPTPPDFETQFETWIEQLVDTGQMPMLERLRATVNRSIADLRRLGYW
ncbi:MAG: hypothetical protein WCO42_04435 [bacterium]